MSTNNLDITHLPEVTSTSSNDMLPIYVASQGQNKKISVAHFGGGTESSGYSGFGGFSGTNGASGGGGPTFADNVFAIQNSSDATKKLEFNLKSFTTGKTLTISGGIQTVNAVLNVPPIANQDTIATQENNNVFTGNNTFSNNNTFTASNTFSGPPTFFTSSYVTSSRAGVQNEIYGQNAGSATIGNQCVIVGNQAGFNMNGGTGSTFIGFGAGFQNTNGQKNTAIGYAAGGSVESGSNNLFLGYGADDTTILLTLNNTAVIGSVAAPINVIYVGGNGAVANSPSGTILTTTGGKQPNTSGANLTIAGGTGTGFGAGGSIIFQTSAAGITGSSTNSLNTVATINTSGNLVMSNGSKLFVAPSTTSNAGINLGVGTTPANPQNGDLWATNTSAYVQINGVTVNLSGSFAGDGSSGFSGYSGFTGSIGVSGSSGFSGFSGISGFSGTNGISGSSGFSGFSGFSGISGFSGTPGIGGVSGFSGFSGTNGSTGTSGFSGFSGISGFSGYSGLTGTTGSSGSSGFSGFSGTNGISGTSGFSGISGFSGATGGSFSGTLAISGGGTSSTTQLSAKLALNIDGKTIISDTNYNILPSDNFIEMTSISSSRALTLPSASTTNPGQIFTVSIPLSNVSSTISVTINASGNDTIENGTTPWTIRTPKGFRQFVSDGVSNWLLIAMSEDVQIFTTTGVNSIWIKEPGCKWVTAEMIGGGGGGGGGAMQASGTVACGGGPGGGAGWAFRRINAADCSGSEVVQVGSGGTSGAATGTNSSNGGNGGAGGYSIFALNNTLAYSAAYSGGAGSGGTTSSGLAGGGGAGINGGANPSPASTTGGGGGAGNSSAQGAAAGGGGAGGGVATSPAFTIGGHGGVSSILRQDAQAGIGTQSNARGSSDGASGGSASASQANTCVAGPGGGGGASSILKFGGTGGNGGLYGGGGGGGGAALNGQRSGPGGTGAQGIVLVRSGIS
jgi:hypothetical protein